jgi:hypothetical protein
MYKLLAFDSWTGGCIHLQRLAPALRSRNIDIKLVHIGSWGNEPTRPRKETIGGIEVADIESYPNRNFEAILDAERPDAVIMLSTATFAHRAFLRYCEQRSIPTLNLYHGLVSVLVTQDHVGSLRVRRLAYWKYAAGRAVKMLTKTLPTYSRALMATNAPLTSWGRLVYDLSKLAWGLDIHQPNVARDAQTTKIAVYNDADRYHAQTTYRIDANDIVAVGNPDLIRFNIVEDMLGTFDMKTRSTRREIVYIDSGLAITGHMYRNVADFCDHLRITQSSLLKQGYSLSVRLHPNHNVEYIASNLGDTGITILSAEELARRLLSSAGCIAETSSATMVPALLGVPLLYTKYGRMKEARFGQLLLGYPRGRELHNLERVRSQLSAVDESDSMGDVLLWIERNAGPLPASEMPRRVAELVHSMISFERTP